MACPIAVNGVTSTLTCRAIPIAGCDLILGMPWLKSVNPNIDWTTGAVDFTAGGVTQHWEALRSTPRVPDTGKATNLMTARQMERALKKGTFAGLVFISVVPDSDQPTCNNLTSQSQADDLEGVDTDNPEATRRLIQEFPEVKQDLPPGTPSARGVPFRIHLEPGHTPPHAATRRMSVAELDELRRQITEYLDRGWIQPSSSPYGAPVLFTRKSDGGLRLCIDYRAVNRLTLKNRYPLPRIEELLDRMRGASYFTKIDLRSGYHQVPLEQEDMPKTAFRTRYGHFEFRVLPFGLTNAPAHFMALMHRIFGKLLDKCVVVFLDDIICYSPTEGQHIEDVKAVLRCLREEKLYIKLSKCSFFKRSISFCGYIVSEEGVSTDPAKIKAVQAWPTPSSLKDTRAFLGFANFYRRFIQGFAAYALPLTNLLRGNKAFVWTKVEQLAFDSLKAALTTTPVLALPDMSLPFKVTTDASGTAIGAVLSQDFGKGDQPIAFESKRLNEAEAKYPAHEQEMLAVVHALRTWRHYLHGSTFQVVTDSSTVTRFQTQKELKGRRARWAEELAEFGTIPIQHKPGKSNVVADALSRLNTLEPEDPQVAQVDSLDPDWWVPEVAPFGLFDVLAHPAPSKDLDSVSLLYQVVEDNDSQDLLERIKAAYPEDPLAQAVLNRETPEALSTYKVIAGLICERTQLGVRLYVPEAVRPLVLQEAHDNHLGGHFSAPKTQEKLERTFTWPLLSTEVRAYCRSCEICQRDKSTNLSPAGFLAPLPIPPRPWVDVSMDFMVDLPRTESGHNALLVVCCRLTKMVHLIKTTTQVTAPEVAQLFFDNIVRLHGIPVTIVSDRDTKFTSNFWRTLWSHLGTKLLFSTAYHPQTDGQTERANRTIQEYLRHYVGEKQTEWDQFLTAAEFTYNNTVHSSTKYTPFQLVYGLHPNTPLTLAAQLPELAVPAVKDFL